MPSLSTVSAIQETWRVRTRRDQIKNTCQFSVYPNIRCLFLTKSPTITRCCFLPSCCQPHSLQPAALIMFSYISLSSSGNAANGRSRRSSSVCNLIKKTKSE